MAVLSDVRGKLSTPLPAGILAASSAPARVALVTMPFGPSVFPAIGLSLLKAVLVDAGCAVTLHYATLAFARTLGCDLYGEIATAGSNDLVGDWVFSHLLGPQSEAQASAYVEDVLRPNYRAEFVDGVLRARSETRKFVADIAREIVAGDPAVVGFTSTFAQNGASLAAAMTIKALRPDVAVMFGGANCEGSMGAELVHRFPFIDAVVSGEGEEVVRELVERLATGRDPGDLPGVSTRAGSLAGPYPNAPVVGNLDDLPIPDFADFFEAVDAVDPSRTALAPYLLVESSRGCWWGEKHHCTFCGLNGSAMGFRSKSPERFIAELCGLVERYGIKHVTATDNILDYRYFRTMLPMLAERRLGLSLFFETKANLRREHIELLDAAGVRAVQPGIESLDSSVLLLMRKGVNALQNVRLLKLCKEFGFHVTWNVLYGFPQEDPAACERMAQLIPLIVHLTPPDLVAQIRLDRFSPHFDDHAAFGFTNVRPARAYAYVYGHVMDSAAGLAYYFDFDYADGRDVSSYSETLLTAIDAWKHVHDESDLCIVDGGAELLLVDRRPNARRPILLLSGLERAVYLACDDIQSTGNLVDAMSAAGAGADAGEIATVCGRFVADGLMLEEDGKYLSLGVSLERGGVSHAVAHHLATAL